MNDVDKFEWIKLVASDGKLTVAERFVLTNTALRYVLYGNDWFRVRQTTIAEQFAVSTRTVERALAAAKKRGYLVLSRERQRGRSHHGPDSHQLVIPDNLTGLLEIPDRNDANTRQDRQEYPTEMTETPDWPDSPTSENADPIGSLKGISIGINEVSARPAAPRPPAPDCNWCKDHNLFLDPRGKPGLNPRICNHDGTWRLATDQEIKDLAIAAARKELRTATSVKHSKLRTVATLAAVARARENQNPDQPKELTIIREGTPK